MKNVDITDHEFKNSVVNHEKIIDLAFETRNFEDLKKHILNGDIDINYTTCSDKTHYFLYRGAHCRSLEFCEFLFENGVDVHSIIVPGNTSNLLHYSCTYKLIEFAKLYIKWGGNIDIPTGLSTPLESSIKKGNKEMAELLLGYQADVNLRDNQDASNALEWAAYQGRYNICELLIKNKAFVNYVTNSTILEKVQVTDENDDENDLKTFNILLQHGASVQPKLPGDFILAMLDGLAINVCEKLKTITPFYKLNSYSTAEKERGEICKALEFYSENPLMKLYGNYFSQVLYKKEQLEKCIKFIPYFLLIVGRLNNDNYRFKNDVFIENKINQILDTYEVEAPIDEIKELLKNDTFDLEHFSIFDYGDYDFDQ